MFGVLAQERYKRKVEADHNKIIRECSLGLDIDDETGEVSFDTEDLLVNMDDDDSSTDEEIALTSEEEQVIDELLKEVDPESLDEEKLDLLACRIVEKLEGISKE